MTLAEAPSSRRVHEIDAVRGFALAGILLANIGFFADPGYAVGTGTMPITEGPVAYLVSTLVLTKFYILFSFLFGYSFTLQTRDGVNVKARMLRRCLGLFVIGVLHGFLLWIGDILTLYTTLGLILLAMRNISPRKAVITGCAVIGVMSVIWLLLAGLTLLDPAGGAAAVADPAAAAQAEALVTGGPLGFLIFQAQTYPAVAAMVWIGQGPMAMALFLFGLAAGRSRLFEEPERWARFVPRVKWVGFGAGLPAAAFFAWAPSSGGALELVALALNNVTSVLLTAAYVVTLLQVIKRFPAAGRALAPAGRVAASNYIGQSALCCLVFTGYGLALAGKLSPLAVMGVAAVIYAVLLGLSRWWLRGHRYGPIEYVLRRLTAGRG
ncbi:DUF418 domain-containing protein [Nonomuraea sp. NEAU-A123]|uniref:DUF418 domain-containing protein n=1 Tax=Nonomuraea sp. NEAU-A123 TaxID=2839649 RepID=UPI001BE3D0BE|nr:DUF418 domain-containing protein [Nonomuraea sp. NEAU-A123]MBT2229263.1 DUF418 domain-containing protein [Nonomuraea sp. NEAU-A123]